MLLQTLKKKTRNQNEIACEVHIVDQTFKRTLTLLSGRGSPEGSENLAKSKGVA